MRVHVTGFDSREKEDFKSKLHALGLQYDENFTFSTDLLICDSIMAQKYRMAKILNIKIVTKCWLVDSFKSKRALEVKDYEYGVLEGLKIHFYNFDVFKLDALKEIVRKNNGIIVKDINKILAGEEQVNFIVVKDASDTERLLPLRSKLFLVNLSWLYNCKLYERFIYPDSFLLPFCTVSLSKVNLKIKSSDLDKLINETESDSEPYNILNGCVFYFHVPELNAQHALKPDDIEISTKLICLMSGFATKKRLRSVTHIVANAIDEEQKEKLSKDGQVFFVNSNYLKDCLLYKKKLIEIEYPSKIIESKAANGNNSRIDSRSSNVNGFRSLKSPSSVTRMPEFKSFLFENVLFYFDKNLKNYKENHFKVFENSGSIILNFERNLIKDKEIFYVLEDGCDENLFKQTKKLLHNYNVTFVSARWIDYCIERKVVVRDIKENRLPHLLPLSHPMPLQEFVGLKFAIKGFNDGEKLVLEELIKILGASLAKFDEEDKGQYKIVNSKASPQNLSDKHKPVSWLFDCLTQGKFIN